MLTLYLAIPCYNEESVLEDTTLKLLNKYNQLIKEKRITDKSRIVYIDDGSKDKTWEIITKLHKANPFVSGLKMSRNRGHQNALYGGLMTLKEYADAVISIDADLQDDINAIDKMLDKYEQGCDIVYGVRKKRDTDTFFKRFTAESFYKILSSMGAEVVFNHADFRLMSKRALDAFAEFKEVNLFLRGMVPMVGFKTATVEYDRFERTAGESKYPLTKMIALAWQGVTSLSVKPIRMIMWLGIFIFIIAVLFGIYSLCSFFFGYTVSGWTSTFISIWALGGLQLFAIGVIGEYLGKIYLETKQRPRFIVEEFINGDTQSLEYNKYIDDKEFYEVE
ncbi:MAG: glycosyltransferase family 2 protein [Acutalibacteraceae bacterium]|nr:glycosyltransferase family 2 protein [Acutalibacteraceae bacterium]